MSPDDVLDFSTGVNPYGPNPVLVQALRDADHLGLPSRSYDLTRARLAAWHGVQVGQVALGAGVGELLHRLARLLLGPGDALLSVDAPPTELWRAAQWQGATVRVVGAEHLPLALERGVSLVYVGHPQARTGETFPAGRWPGLAQAAAEVGATVLVDETYAPFTALGPPPLLPGVLRLLDPGRPHGLLGAAPAYALAEASLTARLDELAPANALTAGTAAALAHLPEGASFLAQTLPRVAQHAQELAQHLSRLGRVEHHGTPFMTVRLGQAAQVSADLLSLGFQVTDCTPDGHPDLIRVSTRLPGENAALIRALTQVQPRTGRHA